MGRADVMLLSALFRHPAASQLDQARWNRQHAPEQPETALAVVQPPRNVHGDPYMEVSSGIGEVHYVPDPPRWTTEPPTHPGLFFVRVPGEITKVVEVYRDDDSRLFFRWTDMRPLAVPRAGLEWSDRAIREPLEAPS